MSRESIEDYLKTIYYFNEKGLSARTSDIASELGVAPPSVTEMLKKLKKEGYLIYMTHEGATLTDKGQNLAERIIRKNRLLVRFLTDTLGINGERAHKQACELEHGFSNGVEEALYRFLAQTNREVKEYRESVPLTSLKVGEVGTLAFIRGGKAAIQRLMDMGLTQGTRVKILVSAPFHGPIELTTRGTTLAIGWGLANKIFVKTISPKQESG